MVTPTQRGEEQATAGVWLVVGGLFMIATSLACSLSTLPGGSTRWYEVVLYTLVAISGAVTLRKGIRVRKDGRKLGREA